MIERPEAQGAESDLKTARRLRASGHSTYPDYTAEADWPKPHWRVRPVRP